MTETSPKSFDVSPDAAHPALASALATKGYATLTPVQQTVLDPKLIPKDLLVSAQTGSGKTVAFGLALAPTLLGEDERFGRTDSPLAIAIAPTRELALQVKRELEWLYEDTGAQFASCVGGMDMRDERRALARGAHIVVGTPGRLCDHIKRGSLDMSLIQAAVLDEADEMLKMGFREELELILDAAPQERRTLMFSATVPKSILGIAKKYQKDAVRVNTAAEAKQHLDIDYQALTVAPSDSEKAIINMLRYYDAKNAIIFGDTRIMVNRLKTRLGNRGFSVVSLSGELSQKDRSAALQAMRDGRAKVCVATDVAARGIDLPELELVIHAAIPKNAEALLHRSGRTGRAGRKGVSALIVPHSGRRRTERLLSAAKVKANWGTPPSAEDVLAKDNERLMADMALTNPVTDDERALVSQLLEAHSPEHIAASFIRQYRETRSAPEELLGVPDYDPSKSERRGRKGKHERGDRPERKARTRHDFENGTWFSLNLGRKQKAEPRWILPMLCKSGDLKKAEIGAIKISETKTFIEIAPGGVDRFIEAIGPQGKIEKAITASRLDGLPDFANADNRPQFKPRDKSQYSKKSDTRPAHKGESFKGDGFKKEGPKKDWPKKDGPKKEGVKKPYEPTSNFDAPKSKKRKNSGDAPPKKKGKRKPHKKKLARAAAKAKAKRSGDSGAKLVRKKRDG